jgi:hypothetical protein
VARTPDASLPIDIHIGADHPNEKLPETVFAHFAALHVTRSNRRPGIGVS